MKHSENNNIIKMYYMQIFEAYSNIQEYASEVNRYWRKYLKENFKDFLESEVYLKDDKIYLKLLVKDKKLANEDLDKICNDWNCTYADKFKTYRLHNQQQDLVNYQYFFLAGVYDENVLSNYLSWLKD